MLRKYRFLLKSDENNRYFTLRPMYTYDIIFLSSSKNEKVFTQTL